MANGRVVPVHASGGGVVRDCIMCGVPYRYHGQDPGNWLACPTRDELVKLEAELEEHLVVITAAIKSAGVK